MDSIHSNLPSQVSYSTRSGRFTFLLIYKQFKFSHKNNISRFPLLAICRIYPINSNKSFDPVKWPKACFIISLISPNIYFAPSTPGSLSFESRFICTWLFSDEKQWYLMPPTHTRQFQSWKNLGCFTAWDHHYHNLCRHQYPPLSLNLPLTSLKRVLRHLYRFLYQNPGTYFDGTFLNSYYNLHILLDRYGILISVRSFLSVLALFNASPPLTSWLSI